LVATGTAHAAAAFASTGVSSTPGADTSTTPQTVEANRPTVTGTFSAPLAETSSVTIVKHGGDGTNLCAGSTVSGSSVSCRPASDLEPGATYDAVAHGIAASDGTAAADSSTFSFQVSYPTYASSVPAPNGALVAADSGHPVQVTFNTRKGLDSSGKSTITVKDFINGQPANPVGGTTSYGPPASLPGQTPTYTTIEFSPSSPLAAGAEYQVVVHVEEVGESATNPATADKTFNFFVQNAAPSQLQTTASIANNVNETAFHFTGVAGAGQTVHISACCTSGTPPLGGQSVSGSGTASVCGQATCPFDVAVDVHSLANGTVTWSAFATDGNGDPTGSTNGPSFQKDDSPPTTPAAPQLSFPTSQTQLRVQDPNPDSPTNDVNHYVIKVTDSGSPARTFGPKSVPTVSGDALDATIDVSGLNDGTLTVDVAAVDDAGNQSAFGESTITKDAGNAPDFADSTISPAGNDISLQAAESHPIQSPTKVTIVFSQNVQPTWTDSSNPLSPKSGTSSLCVADPNGNCQNDATTFPAGNVMQTTISHDLFDVAGYKISYEAWPAAFCHNVSAGGTANGANCKDIKGYLTDPSSGEDFTFTVDDTPPAVPTVEVPSVIDANGIPTVLQGSAERGSSIAISIRSSNGGTPLLESTTADQAGTWQKVISQWPLADGALTINVDAVDAAGNNSASSGQHGTPTHSVTLAARPSAPTGLGVAPNGTQATFVWQPPSYTGGTNRAVTDYVVTLTDDATHSSSSIDQAQSPLTLSPLTPGHSYTLRVYGSNGVPCPCNAASTQFVARYATALSTIAPHVTTYGASVAVHGVLTYAGVGLSGKPVTVTSVYATGRRGPTWHVTTDSYGEWFVFGVRAPKTITFSASYAGEQAYGPSSSGARMLVRVAIRITKITARNSSHLTAVTIRGTVGPNMRGRTVYIYEKRGRHRVRLGHVRLTSKSTFSYSRKFSRGKHYVFARFYSQNGNLGANSRVVRFSRS
jgi:hypothetical protein